MSFYSFRYWIGFQQYDINELPQELFDIINDTINETSVVCPEFVIGNHFTDKSKNELSRVWVFLHF